MNRYSESVPKCLRSGLLLLDGGFFTNGTSSPVSTTHFGQLGGATSLMTVTYGATGLYTVVLAAGITFPSTPIIIPSVVCVSQAASYDIKQIGAWNATTRTFVLGMLDFTGAAVAPAAANAGSYVNFLISVIDTAAR